MSDITSDLGATPDATPQPPIEQQNQTQRLRQADGTFSPKQPSQEPQKPAAQVKAAPINGTTGELNKRAGAVDGTPPATEEPKPSAPQKFKVKTKVDGVEREDEIDEATLQRDYQKWRASDARMREAAEKSKRSDAIMQAFSSGDAETLRAMGIDLDDLASKRMAMKAREALMPPEQIELERTKAQLAQYKAQVDAINQQQQQAQEAHQKEAFRQQFQPEMIAELEKHNIPRDVGSLKLAGHVLLEAADQKIDLTPAQAVQEVARRQQERTQRYMVQPWKQNPDDFVAFCRREGLLEVARTALEKEWQAKSGISVPRQAAPVEREDAAEKREPIYSDSDWLKSLKRK